MKKSSENRVLDLELSSKEEKNLKDQLGSELSRVRSELRQVQKEFDKERDELKTKILDKDREVSFLTLKFLNFFVEISKFTFLLQNIEPKFIKCDLNSLLKSCPYLCF